MVGASRDNDFLVGASRDDDFWWLSSEILTFRGPEGPQCTTHAKYIKGIERRRQQVSLDSEGPRACEQSSLVHGGSLGPQGSHRTQQALEEGPWSTIRDGSLAGGRFTKHRFVAWPLQAPRRPRCEGLYGSRHRGPSVLKLDSCVAPGHTPPISTTMETNFRRLNKILRSIHQKSLSREAPTKKSLSGTPAKTH